MRLGGKNVYLTNSIFWGDAKKCDHGHVGPMLRKHAILVRNA